MKKVRTPLSMNRIRALARLCLLLLLTSGVTFAQAPAASKPGNIESLKEAIEKQGRQIEALTLQIAELNRRLATQKDGSVTEQPAAQAAPTAPPSDAAPAAPATEAPRAEAVAQTTGIKHTVAKGETLTSIAKRYNIPLVELEKANKIENDRKLQIGQVLTLPATTTKTAQPQTEAKENP
jgi:LysM repeat protein